MIPVGTGVFLNSYIDSSTVDLFVGHGVETGRVQRDRAALRRECTGLVLHAFRVTVAAEADYLGFVRYATLHESAAVFEYIGRRSHKKAIEGNLHRLVLLAVRFHASGEYWVDEQMRAVAAAFGVPVVQRLYHLEGMRICELQKEVDS